MMASSNRSPGVVHALLAAGANKDAQNAVGGGGHGKGAGSPVGFICCKRSQLGLMLSTTCRVQRGRTALMMASVSARLEVVRALLSAGADKEARDNVSAK